MKFNLEIFQKKSLTFRTPWVITSIKPHGPVLDVSTSTSYSVYPLWAQLRVKSFIFYWILPEFLTLNFLYDNQYFIIDPCKYFGDQCNYDIESINRMSMPRQHIILLPLDFHHFTKKYHSGQI